MLAVLFAAVTVSFVQEPDGAAIQSLARAAVADFGTVSAGASSAPGVQIVRGVRSYAVSTSVGLRAVSDGEPGPFALQAFLDEPLRGITVRLDGVELSTLPITFGAAVPANVVTRHRLELEIPAFMPFGQIPSDIGLEVGAFQE